MRLLRQPHPERVDGLPRPSNRGPQQLLRELRQVQGCRLKETERRGKQDCQSLCCHEWVDVVGCSRPVDVGEETVREQCQGFPSSHAPAFRNSGDTARCKEPGRWDLQGVAYLTPPVRPTEQHRQDSGDHWYEGLRALAGFQYGHFRLSQADCQVFQLVTVRGSPRNWLEAVGDVWDPCVERALAVEAIARNERHVLQALWESIQRLYLAF